MLAIELSNEHPVMTLPVVFIDGDQGTTGLQIHQRLQARTDLTLVTLPAEQRKNAKSRAAAINACDIAILCLPDDAARAAAASIENPNVRVIDASSAHRTDAEWVYGFAQMSDAQQQTIATAKRVSNPGCYPTGAIGLLRPLLDAGLVRDVKLGRERCRELAPERIDAARRALDASGHQWEAALGRIKAFVESAPSA